MEVLHSLFLRDLPRLGGWDFFTYLFFLFYGYLFAYDKQFREAPNRNFIIAIILGLLSAVALILMNIFYFDSIWLSTSFDNISFPFLFARTFFAWSWLIVILNLADKYLNKRSKAVKTLNEFVLPFYIIHYVVLAIVGFYIVQLEILVISKLFLIFLISLAVIIVLLFLIREFNALRFIFGMQVTKKKRIARFFKKKKVSKEESVRE